MKRLLKMILMLSKKISGGGKAKLIGDTKHGNIFKAKKSGRVGRIDKGLTDKQKASDREYLLQNAELEKDFQEIKQSIQDDKSMSTEEKAQANKNLELAMKIEKSKLDNSKQFMESSIRVKSNLKAQAQKNKEQSKEREGLKVVKKQEVRQSQRALKQNQAINKNQSKENEQKIKEEMVKRKLERAKQEKSQRQDKDLQK